MPKSGRPKKPGPRKPCGRLAFVVDTGHPMVLERRAELVGDFDKEQREAGYVIGRLWLAGDLFDVDADRNKKEAIALARRRHDVLVKFAAMHFRIWGPGTPPSHLRDIITGMRLPPPVATGTDRLAGLYLTLRRWQTAVMTLPPGQSRILVHQVLDRAALYEISPATDGELEALRRGADVLIELDGGRARGRRDRQVEEVPRHAPGSIQPIFARARFGPGDRELLDAVARLKAARPNRPH